jgi:phosphate-selective porin OprO/OprP
MGRIDLDRWSFPDSSPGVDVLEHPGAAPLTLVDPEDRLEFRRTRIGVKGNLDPGMHYKLELEFYDPGNALLRDVYFGFDDLPLLQLVIIGNQKRPLGFDQLTSSRYNAFMERAAITDAFNEDQRRPGMMSIGKVEGRELYWQAGMFGLENVSGDGKYLGDHDQESFNLRVRGLPVKDEAKEEFLHLAVATMHGNPDGNADGLDGHVNEARFRGREVRSEERWLNTGRIAGADSFDILGSEVVYSKGPFTAVLETMDNRVEREGMPQDLHLHGAYGYLAWFLTGEHQPYDSQLGTFAAVKPRRPFFRTDEEGEVEDGWGALQLALRYSRADLTDQDVLGGVGSNWTLGLNWWWNTSARMQINAVHGQIEERALVAGLTGGDFTSLGTRLMVSF